jgi:hypothetical protein
MIKHVGRHNQRKVAIVYRTVPDEDHMALVVYTDSLPVMVHDEAMKVLESEVGQNAKELADALFRSTMADGNNCLTSLHKGGYLKKVPCNQVIVTPTAKSTCRLDELNNLLKKIEEGGDAAAALADMDANRGIKGVVKEGREVGTPARTTSADMFGETPTAPVDVLSDADIADMNLTQAQQMEAQAKGLLAEAKRLKAEAASLKPAKAPAKAKATTTPAKAKNVTTTKTKKAAA